MLADSAVRTLALLTRFRGANWGATGRRHRAIPGHVQPRRRKKNCTSGHMWRLAATARRYLLSSGSRVRILPGAQVRGLLRSLTRCLGTKRGASGGSSRRTQAKGKRRRQGEGPTYQGSPGTTMSARSASGSTRTCGRIRRKATGSTNARSATSCGSRTGKPPLRTALRAAAALNGTTQTASTSGPRQTVIRMCGIRPLRDAGLPG